jgi:hypothetical protein
MTKIQPPATDTKPPPLLKESGGRDGEIADSGCAADGHNARCVVQGARTPLFLLLKPARSIRLPIPEPRMLTAAVIKHRIPVDGATYIAAAVSCSWRDSA